MKAIVYTSNAGSTAEYAQLLGNELNHPEYSLNRLKIRYLAAVRLFILDGLWQKGSRNIKGP